MHGDSTFHEALSDLFDGGWIDEVLYEVRSGKEATVFCCRAGARSLERLSEFSTPHSTAPRLSADILLAAKVYRDLESRRFKNDAIYQTGRVHLAREGRIKRAADNKSHFGRQVQYGMWIEHEWETLRVLHEAGLPVPAPIARGERSILMTYLGDADGPAPALAEIDLPRDQAWDTFDHLLDAVFAMLSLDRVHGDLSAYNILYWEGTITLIDFPQVTDARSNPDARAIFARDVRRVCEYFARYGIRRDAASLAATLWDRFWRVSAADVLADLSRLEADTGNGETGESGD